MCMVLNMLPETAFASQSVTENSDTLTISTAALPDGTVAIFIGSIS